MSKAQIIQLRKQIEVADQSIFDLINSRMELSKQMAAAKGTEPTYDPKREEDLVQLTSQYCKSLPNVSEELVAAIYPHLFKQSRELQHEAKLKETQVD